ncbi:hypothetical protein G6L63_12020 [Agrobacterium vitis]|uniref:Uncharacterized protein n=1 Tax=Agrobacterium vitis TaxID=373 RepID=A0A368NLF9_AGRVI|nr:hypothetical protein [Agrobacterium vitis]KAA3511817.1 hypothetical protein DXM22_16395 [Agrobacterium vitis]KAA3525262.1 hypothetical protein DXT89_18185 [Agrobacterium vitis]MCF1479281.1 hypothetical protein [Agrobacterium vitis]MUZ97630.1 hypothetical protein [Agrobacterium vitis]MVA30391.1 hypothetical protein [Agrobacterium vitis]
MSEAEAREAQYYANRGQVLTAGPTPIEEFIANQRRTQPVLHSNQQGFSQRFRGIVAPNSEVVLQTNGVVLNTVNFDLFKAGHSELTILPSTSRDGVPGAMNTYAPDKTKPNQGAAMRAVNKVMKTNKIISIIRGPLDQIIDMQVYFGDGHWSETYNSGKTYQFRTKGAAETAMIKLKLNNPMNSAYFNMFVSIRMVPPEKPVSQNGESVKGIMERLDEYTGSIRDFAKNHNPF